MLVLLASLLSCADDPDDGDGAESCASCGSGEVCVAALYDLCEEGWIGVGCSASGASAIVSCNPDE